MDDAISRISRIHMEKLCTTTPLSSTAFQRSNVQFYNQNEWKKGKNKRKNNENYEDEEAYNIEYARSVHTNWYRKCIRFNRKMHITRR